MEQQLQHPHPGAHPHAEPPPLPLPTPLKMRMAVVQFAPELEKVYENISKANKILAETSDVHVRSSIPLWIVLPEMAFTGYNFTSLDHIRPYLETQDDGLSTNWARQTARKYRAYVTVGYPEKTTPSTSSGAQNGHVAKNYNSTITVSPTGETAHNYRKRYLYYTDEAWAEEGDGQSSPSGFFNGDIEGIPVSMGICMDINPYQFLAPWDKYEFAHHVLESKSKLVVLSMAWLTRLPPQTLSELPRQPDDDTMAYWFERLYPLQSVPDSTIYVVVANRCGIEREACFAGSSLIVCFKDGKGFIYDRLGKQSDQCMVVDLTKGPKYAITTNALMVAP